MKLVEALRADNRSRMAFVGAGGKTTALFSLARQLAAPVICINTAHLAVEQAKLADVHYPVSSLAEVDARFRRLPRGVVLFSGLPGENDRLSGVNDEVADRIRHLADRRKIPVLIEADGARMLPIKAPAEHEPVIPAWVNQVVVVAGLSGIGRPVDGDHIFRPQIFTDLTGAAIGEHIELIHLNRLLLHPQGGLKNIPSRAERSVLLNQRDMSILTDSELSAFFSKLVPAYDRILLGAVQNQSESQITWRHEGVCGVVLAAGGSKRMGQAKQLLQWRGKPLVRHTAEIAIAAGLNPVIVVAGAEIEEISAALAGIPAEIVCNQSWRSGVASSIKAAVKELGSHSGAAVFLLADMPEVPVELIQAEVSIFQTEAVKTVVPRINGNRSNPVLFDRSTFPDLSRLQGDTGGRALFDRYPLRWLDWTMNHEFTDVDTLEDYTKLLKGDLPGG